MTKKKVQHTEGAELRRRAEEFLRAKAKGAPLSRTVDEMQRILHELEVHQIELEMQNDELRQARDEVDTALEKYTDLYDFAPVGYFTLDRDGIIRGVNLTGAIPPGDRALPAAWPVFREVRPAGRPSHLHLPSSGRCLPAGTKRRVKWR